MESALTYRALGISAHRVLSYLRREHLQHGGKENGKLAAPYRALEDWGVTANDVRGGLEELYVTGFVQLTFRGPRVASGVDPSRYALTWLPTEMWTPTPVPATNKWQRIAASLFTDGVNDVASTRAWLRENTAHARRGSQAKQKRAVPTQLNPASARYYLYLRGVAGGIPILSAILVQGISENLTERGRGELFEREVSHSEPWGG